MRSDGVGGEEIKLLIVSVAIQGPNKKVFCIFLTTKLCPSLILSEDVAPTQPSVNNLKSQTRRNKNYVNCAKTAVSACRQ